jgi:hypothetical protein
MDIGGGDSFWLKSPFDGAYRRFIKKVDLRNNRHLRPAFRAFP